MLVFSQCVPCSPAWRFCAMKIGSLSNDDRDVNENSMKATGLYWQNNNSARASRFFSLPSMHDYDVKMPNFTFCGGHEQKTTFFFVSYNLTQSFRIQLQKNLPTFDELNEMEQTRLSFRQSEFTF